MPPWPHLRWAALLQVDIVCQHPKGARCLGRDDGFGEILIFMFVCLSHAPGPFGIVARQKLDSSSELSEQAALASNSKAAMAMSWSLSCLSLVIVASKCTGTSKQQEVVLCRSRSYLAAAWQGMGRALLGSVSPRGSDVSEPLPLP